MFFVFILRGGEVVCVVYFHQGEVMDVMFIQVLQTSQTFTAIYVLHN